MIMASPASSAPPPSSNSGGDRCRDRYNGASIVKRGTRTRRRILSMNSILYATLLLLAMFALTAEAAADDNIDDVASVTINAKRLKGSGPLTRTARQIIMKDITKTSSHEPQRILQKGQQQQHQRRMLNEVEQESTKSPTSADDTPATTTSATTDDEESTPSSVFNDSHYQSSSSDPFESTRDELGINVTEIVAMKLTGAPASAPTPPAVAPILGAAVPSPSAATPSMPSRPYYGPTSYHGPHLFYDTGNDDPFYPDNDDPPPGSSGSSGSSSSHPYDKLNDPTYVREETDFREFLAFVGWYAFLIICCLLPTVCAYYRRRRNARALRENLAGIQERLAEIERRRGEEGVEVLDNLSGENRDQEWEFLEQLFGSSPRSDEHTTPFNTNPNTTTAEEEATQRSRRIMSDIMGHVGMASRVLDFMEREQRRKRERGRRLVGALKDCSMIVEEGHLVRKRGREEEVGDNVCATIVEGSKEEDEEDGDIEMGNITNSGENDDDGNEDIMKDASINDAEQVKETHGESSDSKQDGNETSDADNEHGSFVDERTEENKPATTSTAAKRDDSPSALPSNSGDNNGNEIQAVSVDAAVPTAPPLPQSTTTTNNTNPLTSLYAIDNPYLDDSDDEDNLYSALQIPTPNFQTSELTRLVTPTCAICLLQYTPGNYVSWSSNKQCLHVFHRDCILMWLLKKEEPLCPCCRREFVLESVLSGEEDEDGGDGGGNNVEVELGEGGMTIVAGDGEAAAGLDGARVEEVAQPQSGPIIATYTTSASSPPQREVRYSNLPGSFSVGGGGSTRASSSSAPRTSSSRLDSFSIRSL